MSFLTFVVSLLEEIGSFVEKERPKHFLKILFTTDQRTEKIASYKSRLTTPAEAWQVGVRSIDWSGLMTSRFPRWFRSRPSSISSTGANATIKRGSETCKPWMLYYRKCSGTRN
jgi:hypothetical protein